MNLRKEREKGKKVSRRPPGVQVAVCTRARARASRPRAAQPAAARLARRAQRRCAQGYRWEVVLDEDHAALVNRSFPFPFRREDVPNDLPW